MKAIDTKYKDIRFRSRTEARWAVFFDALGIRWMYEEEGYALPSPDEVGATIYYLPDFYLPDINIWVEIKGLAANEEEDRKARALCAESARAVLLLAGSPINPKYQTQVDHLLYIPQPEGEVEVRPAYLPTVLGKRPNSPEWIGAFGEAMGARFEHGESPKAKRLL